jgi:serine/threonine-protein kinase
MNEPQDPNRTVDVPSIPAVNEHHNTSPTVDVPSGPADSLGAGLAAGFGPRSSLGDMQPVRLKEAEGEGEHVVQPKSDAMPPPEQTGDRYQLQGEIARGGMGAVLRGRDVDLGRDLAVKVLLEKHANRPEVAQRFLEEAQIGGQLQHPGVVPVYDIGRFGDRPFFTMKLVKGQTLQALLAERADPAADRPRFLAVALQVAQTLAYAHARGVIHRDLKPANVMVGSFGEVQVMDWGLAKVLAEGGAATEEGAGRTHQLDEGTLIRTARSSGTAGSFGTATEAGSLLGTPAYMPPEQANGDIANLDRRADVFGLGAILCEILTGKPPYVGRSHEEVRRKACNGDLADANARLDSCGADQELIVLTKACLSPEAIDRPKDAQAVAEGLTAYLDGVQERLHQAELAEAEAKARAAEEAKRRRVTLALAGTVLLAVTLGGGGFLWVKADRDARQAQVIRDVNDALNRATALREQAKANVGSLALFAQAREQATRAQALVESGPADDTLKSQVRQLQAELDEEEKDRQLVAALDEARLAQVETLSENRFALERALPLFREAFRAYGLPAGQGEPSAAAERIRKRPPVVREAITTALDEWDDLANNPTYRVTEPHREWLRAVLEAAEPDDAWSRKVRAARRETDRVKRQAALEALAKSARVANLSALALTRLASSLRPPQAAGLLRRAQQHYPADFWVNHYLGIALMQATPPERDEAIRFLTAATALRPESPGAHTNLGVALDKNRQFDEAIASHRKAIELNPKYAAAHNNLGIALAGKGKVDEAIASFRKAIDLDPKDASLHNNLGNALKDRGQYDEAIANFKKAVELDPKDAMAHFNLGNALAGKGQMEEAIASFKKAIDLDPKDANAHVSLGIALRDRGKYDEAIASCRKAIELDPKLAGAHLNLGLALILKGQVDEAIASCRKAIELDPKLANAHSSLGMALLGKGLLDEAIASFKKTLELDPKHSMARSLLAQAERLAAARDKLPAFQKGTYVPAGTQEYLELIEWCRIKKLHHTAVRLYAAAFTADPKLAADLKAAHCYNAACHASLAAAGQGADAAGLGEKEQVELRRQALTWLRADLALCGKQLESGQPAGRAEVQRALSHWQKDGDLAGLRDAAALAKLPDEERAAFTKLWADVAALLKKAETRLAKQGKETDDVPRPGKGHEAKGEEEAEKLKQANEHLKAGKRDLAMPLLVEVFNSKKARLGPDHADTLASMNQLGVVYWQLRQLDKAVPLFEKLLKIREKKLGRDHLDTLHSVANLGVNYKDVGKLKEAIELLEEAHRAAQKNRQLAWVINPLVEAYDRAGENAKLADLLLKVLPGARKELPKDSAQLAGLLAQIGMALLNQKKWDEAEPLLRECLTIREKAQPDVWTTFNAKSMFGGVLLGQKKYKEAEPLLLAGYQGMKKQQAKIPPPGKVRLPEAVERLVRLYEALGKKDEVARWQKELEVLRTPQKKP